MAEARIEISGTAAVLDPAGALWLPASRALVIADLHLEKSSSFARRGMFLPPYDSGATLMLLQHLIVRRNPSTVICLGDSFHDSGGFSRLPEIYRARLTTLQHGRRWIWISGNHDRDLPAEIGQVVYEIMADGLTFRHEPRAAEAPGEIAGHLHPSAKICGRGRAVRCRAFVTDGERMVLPAFGVLTGGLNVLDRAFAPLFSRRSLRAILIGGGRLFPVAAAALSPD